MKTFYVSVALWAAVRLGFAAEPATAQPERAPVASAMLLTADYLGQLTDEMRTNQPALKAAYLRTNAAAAGVNAVRTWEDPMAKLGGMAAREPMRADEGDIIYGVEQKLPLFGKPELARQVARSELATETASAEYQFQFQRSELAKTLFAAAFADQTVALGEQDLEWLTTIARAADTRFRAGQATLMETVQVENERARRETQLQTDRDQLTQRHAELNRLLNRDVRSPWPRLELPPIAGAVPYSE